MGRAKMMDADILMMDEPTGHLDKFNIAWLIDYVNSLKSREKPVTVIAVSHDTEYLEKTTTHILEFENRKLNTFRGNIKEFVKKNPEAKIYFEITTSAKVKFVFPDPGPLEGVKSRGKALLKMTDVHFQYPGTPKPQLYGAGVHAFTCCHSWSKWSGEEHYDQVPPGRMQAYEGHYMEAAGKPRCIHVPACLSPH